ncbi:hypothetical protein O1L60_34610 [Streptomyces diastatochromogenes]|nr:hypothetical protein [Streptomyces diastatochromogenes]
MTNPSQPGPVPSRRTALKAGMGFAVGAGLSVAAPGTASAAPRGALLAGRSAPAVRAARGLGERARAGLGRPGHPVLPGARRHVGLRLRRQLDGGPADR